ncbi:MmgE/PrpD family protein [Pseudonocardia sp. MH-G8]|uniref:MmgE/PrpD family protein n=1 Tax=Pseudonocardia sp. MH-G8 TaxID=1854588 RepID=UPI000BA01C19|nr:MmgE/PrpD family protein [Pseudonocardia sp. MH-G8]OZM76084.1 2-methylcitrate dehydratase [Pseudonocardia sp. MH-G8]
MGVDTVQGVSWRLAEYVAGFARREVPEAATVAAARSLLDAVGVSLAATGLGEGTAAFADLAQEESGRGASTLLWDGTRLPAAPAAFANGALAHALDFEDAVDGLAAHPNAQVVPAALALAEEYDATGAELLASMAVGCDITCRVADLAGERMSARGWYPPPIAGAIGATVAGAMLARLDTAQVLDALSLAVSQTTASGEVKHSPDSLIRGVRDAFAAHAAVRAVQLAGRGIRGFAAPLEGRAGFLATYAGADLDPAPLVDGLGQDFWGTEVSVKAWPSCRGTHSFIEAALRLRTEVDLDAVAAIDLVGAPVNRMLAEPLAAKRAPRTAIDAKFSLPFTVALALVDGVVELGSFAPDRLVRPDLLVVARKVAFRPEPTWDTPARMTSGRLCVRLADGRERTLEVARPPGGPDAPMSTARLVEKFIDCAGHALHSVGSPERVATQLLDIGAAPSVRTLLVSLFPETEIESW